MCYVQDTLIPLHYQAHPCQPCHGICLLTLVFTDKLAFLHVYTDHAWGKWKKADYEKKNICCSILVPPSF